MSKALPSLVGKTFGLWTVLSRVENDNMNSITYLCKCTCGAIRKVVGRRLRTERSRSCGCRNSELTSERFIKHGNSTTREFKIWRNMISRCHDKKSISYSAYGKRGIIVCSAWLASYDSFITAMGECPAGKSLDRIDNDGNYEPSNCRWADFETQCSNKRNSRYIECRGRKQTLSQWAKEVEMGAATLRFRLKMKWGVEEAIFTPVQNENYKIKKKKVIS